MFRHLFHLTVAAALIVAVGGHWAMLQSVAWVGMAVNYSKSEPISVALKKTFDGEHPCKLCIAVKKGQQEEQQQAVLKVETKLDFLCLDPFAFVSPALPFTLLSHRPDIALPRTEAPPLPPPRSA